MGTETTRRGRRTSESGTGAVVLRNGEDRRSRATLAGNEAGILTERSQQQRCDQPR